MTPAYNKNAAGMGVPFEEKKASNRRPDETPEESAGGASEEDQNDNPYSDFVHYRSQSARLGGDMRLNQLEWQDADYARMKAAQRENQNELLAYQSIH